jgi:glycosyltransferase involved in cell wall biosynthesis
MDTQIRDSIASDNYDLVIASQTMMASYFNCFHGFPAIFEEAEVGIYYQNYVQSILTWHRIRNGLTWMKHRHYLFNLLPHFRKCTVVSKPELDLLTKINRNYQAFEIIPNCIDIDLYTGYTKHIKPHSLIFTGSFRYSVNYDAMVWFINEVYPKIQSVIPNATLSITGDHANLRLPTYKGVTLTGYLDDIRPLIADSFISIVPIRFGGGTRLKILESMALYTPVVTTSKGAEGLDIQNEHNIMIADTPEAFVEAIIRLFNNPEFYKRLTQNAYQLVREKYDCSVVMPYFLDLVEQTVRS